MGVVSVKEVVKETLWGRQDDHEKAGSYQDKNKAETRSFIGRVTSYDKTTSSGMIDNSVYFDISAIIGQAKPRIGVSVDVQASREHSLASWRATMVQLINQWIPEEEETIVHKVVGFVSEEGKTSCIILCEDDEIIYKRETGRDGYYPRMGDWVSLKLLEEHGDITISDIKPQTQKTIKGHITYFTGRYGNIDEDIGFTLAVCQNGYQPHEKDEVEVTCIECCHSKYSWRAISVAPVHPVRSNINFTAQHQPKDIEENGMMILGEGDFGDVVLSKKVSISFIIKNNAHYDHTLVSCRSASLKDQLWIGLSDGNEIKDETLSPNDSIEIQLDLVPLVLGRLVTAVIFDFGSFKLNHSVRANVTDSHVRLVEPSQPYLSRYQRHSRADVRYHDRITACGSSGPRPKMKTLVRLPHKLRHYLVPGEIRECIDLQEDATFIHPALSEPLSWDTCQEYFSTLLYFEEVQMELNMQEFDMKSVCMSPRGPYLSLGVPGLAEGRPSVLVGDKVIVCEPGGDERCEHHKGYIHEVHGCDILIKFADSFHENYYNEDYDISFTFSRTPLRRMHQAVELIPSIGNKSLFPCSPSSLPPIINSSMSSLSFFNSQLNQRQKTAVVRILGSQGRPCPYIVFGPPGTGKTVTIVEAILQIYKLNGRSSRILACAPSNSAADLIAERLLMSGVIDSGDLIRLNAIQRGQLQSDILQPHCIDTSSVNVAVRHKIVVCTCVTSGIMFNMGLSIGHFTHVFVDEAGQATEPECLIPLSLLAGTNRQVVLAGDPYQLGPVLQSKMALSHGLGVSLLERLMNRHCYQRDEDKFSDHGCYDPLLVTKLITNYRSHESLLCLFSRIFYDDELVPSSDPALTHTLVDWEGLMTRGFPFIFHGLLGEDLREGNSPSWFNPVEAVQCVRYAQRLLCECESLTTDGIGIITPYRKQVEKIRLLLQRTGLDDIKVGSVEEFQGQEKQAIILSTVRSNKDLLTFDIQHNLGFLSNPKRFNVSISRSQALLIVIGNPILLKRDRYWSQLIDYAISNGAYTGCPLPND